MSTDFFDPYVAFYHTPRKPRDPDGLRDKLNRRYELLIAPNRPIIEGKRILDLGSHDGRWSFAALQAGARLVIGVEPREQLTQYAKHNLRQYGCAADTYEFVVGNVFEVLQDRHFEIDTIFCFGLIYHSVRHVELMSLMDNLHPAHIILDSTICDQAGSLIELHTEDVTGLGNAFRDQTTVNYTQIVGWPSQDALILLLTHLGYTIERLDRYTQRQFQRVAIVAAKQASCRTE